MQKIFEKPGESPQNKAKTSGKRTGLSPVIPEYSINHQANFGNPRKTR